MAALGVNGVNGAQPPAPPVVRSQSFLDRVKAFKEKFKYVNKTNTAVDSVFKFIETIGQLPHVLKGVLIAARPAKVVNGALAVEQLVTSVKAATQPGLSIKDRFLTAWKGVDALREMSFGAESACKLANEAGLVSKKALAWVTARNYVLLPVSLISSALRIFETHKKVSYLNRFRQDIKVAKVSGERSSIEDMKRVAERLLVEVPTLKGKSIIKQDTRLDERLNNILTRLRENNDVEAANETKFIARALKDRISEHVGIFAVDTAVIVSKLVITVLGVFFPVLKLPVALINVVMGPAGLAGFLHSKRVPTGDIEPTEKRMFFATVFKGCRKIKKIITQGCSQLMQRVQHVVQRRQPIPVAVS